MKNINYHFAVNSLTNTVTKAIGEVPVPQNIKVEYFLEGEAEALYFDEYHIREVVKNLMTNAVEAIQMKGNKDGRIQITIFQESHWKVVKIFDNGTGIEKKMCRKIFSPYYSTKSKKQNWGIGLSYSKKIMDAHYGYLWAESRPRESTTFYMMLKGENDYV